MFSSDSPHRHLAQCTSTNDLARDWVFDAADPAPHGALVTAGFQTAGRGRRGRHWEAAAGEGVLMSVVLRPEAPRSAAWRLAFIAALAVADVLADYGIKPLLKWPNDVLVDGKKIAGILVETLSCGPDAWAAIVGIGVNINQAAFANADALLQPPISLRMATGEISPVAQIALEIRAAVEARTAWHESSDWDRVLVAWRHTLAHGAILQRGLERGLLEDIDPDGAARVRLPDGTFARWVTVEAEEGGNARANRV